MLVLLEVVLVAKGLDESFLDQIIGVLTITGKAHGETAQEILVADEEVVEFNRRHLVQRSDPKIRQSCVPCKILFNFPQLTMNKMPTLVFQAVLFNQKENMSARVAATNWPHRCAGNSENQWLRSAPISD